MLNKYTALIFDNIKKYLFNFFNALVLLEWFEEVIHVSFFEARLRRKNKYLNSHVTDFSKLY